MIILGDRLSRSSIPFYAFGLLLLTACPLLFPKIGEQQYSYVQGLCFLSLAWMFLRNLSPTALEPALKLARLYRDTGRVKEALEILNPYQKVSPKGKTLEQ